MRMISCRGFISVLFGLGIVPLLASGAAAEPEVTQVLDVSPVWAGHPVSFCLLTHPPYQFAAYYDAERKMTVASRELDEETWTYQELPERVGWDSHNSITMTVDDNEDLHLSGNLHVHPLKYFRTSKPLDVTSFERIPAMVGDLEDRTTYPSFFRGPANELIFTYRDGKSGSGNQVYNVYDHETHMWNRLLDKPLTDGEGLRNAYLHGPVKGQAGYWHLCWVWRESPDCATNNHPSYARSKDLKHWENSRGEALTLPITRAMGDVVDLVPVGGGIINGNCRLGFDLDKRPVVTYHKYDETGITQLYNARSEAGAWKVYLASEWDYRWDFSGGGSIPFEISVGPVQAEGGTLVQSWKHPKQGKQKWRLDAATLGPIERLELPRPTTPRVLGKLESGFPGMHVKTQGDSGTSGEPGVRYYLRWEALGPNRDRPREKPWPEPSMLRVYRVE